MTPEPPVWVARRPLADMLVQAGLGDELAGRELARRAGLDPRTVRDVLGGRRGPWVRLETAERLLDAADCSWQLSELEPFVSARA